MRSKLSIYLVNVRLHGGINHLAKGWCEHLGPRHAANVLSKGLKVHVGASHQDDSQWMHSLEVKQS